LTKVAESHHRDLASTVAGTVQQLLLRDKASPRAKYYAVVFLNQLVLSKRTLELANHLMKIYFSVFEWALGADEGKSKLVAAVLTGVNRALPFCSLDKDFLTSRMDGIFRLVHTSSFNTSVQALRLLLQVRTFRVVLQGQCGVAYRSCTRCVQVKVLDPSISDRFYRALYATLSSPELTTTSKHSLYLNLIFRAMKVRRRHGGGSVFAAVHPHQCQAFGCVAGGRRGRSNACHSEAPAAGGFAHVRGVRGGRVVHRVRGAGAPPRRACVGDNGRECGEGARCEQRCSRRCAPRRQGRQGRQGRQD
jgi:hypothetical protein